MTPLLGPAHIEDSSQLQNRKASKAPREPELSVSGPPRKRARQDCADAPDGDVPVHSADSSPLSFVETETSEDEGRERKREEKRVKDRWLEIFGELVARHDPSRPWSPRMEKYFKSPVIVRVDLSQPRAPKHMTMTPPTPESEKHFLPASSSQLSQQLLKHLRRGVFGSTYASVTGGSIAPGDDGDVDEDAHMSDNDTVAIVIEGGNQLQAIDNAPEDEEIVYADGASEITGLVDDVDDVDHVTVRIPLFSASLETKLSRKSELGAAPHLVERVKDLVEGISVCGAELELPKDQLSAYVPDCSIVHERNAQVLWLWETGRDARMSDVTLLLATRLFDHLACGVLAEDLAEDLDGQLARELIVSVALFAAGIEEQDPHHVLMARAAEHCGLEKSDIRTALYYLAVSTRKVVWKMSTPEAIALGLAVEVPAGGFAICIEDYRVLKVALACCRSSVLDPALSFVDPTTLAWASLAVGCCIAGTAATPFSRDLPEDISWLATRMILRFVDAVGDRDAILGVLWDMDAEACAELKNEALEVLAAHLLDDDAQEDSEV